MRRLVALLAVFAAVVLPAAAHARAAGAGMAGAYGLKARGVEAPFWNPALLAWDDTLFVQVLSFTGSFHNNSFSLADYNRWNGERWDDETKRRILERIDGDLAEGRAEGQLAIPGAAAGGWALTAETRGAGRGKLSKEAARLILFGNMPEESFRLEGSEGIGVAYSILRLSHARGTVTAGGWRVAGGASVSYVRGWAYGEVLRATGRVETTPEYLHGDGVLEELTSLGGDGVGLDAGVALASPAGWSFGATLENVGAIWWSSDVKVSRQTVQADSVNLDEQVDDPDLILTESASSQHASFRTSLDPSVTLAVAKTIDDVHLEVDLRQGLREGPETTTTPRLALGAAQAVRPWFEMRTGIAVGGLDGPVYALGSGFAAGRLRLDAAFLLSGRVNPLSGKGLGAGLSVGWR